MNRHRPSRGVSLLELLVVVTLVGIFSSAVLMRFGREVFHVTEARSQARIISLALLQAQRAAIRTGDPHGVLIGGSLSKAESWSVVQKLPDGSSSVVDGPYVIAPALSVSASHGEMWFDFEGVGSQMFRVQLVGASRSYEIAVEPLTRMIRTHEVTP